MRSGVAPHAQSARGGQDGKRDAGSNGDPQHHAASIAAAPRPDKRDARWRVRWYGADEPDVEGSCHNGDEAVAFIRRYSPTG